jgi:hypothetical protein
MIADSCYQWGYGTRFWSMYYYTTTCNSGADICMYRARAFIRVMKHLDYYYYAFSVLLGHAPFSSIYRGGNFFAIPFLWPASCLLIRLT